MTSCTVSFWICSTVVQGIFEDSGKVCSRSDGWIRVGGGTISGIGFVRECQEGGDCLKDSRFTKTVVRAAMMHGFEMLVRLKD